MPILQRLIRRIADMKFRNKLIGLFVLISILPLGVLGVLSYNYASYTVQEKVYQTILESNYQINHSINYFINDIVQLSMYIYGNESVQQVLTAAPQRQTAAERYAEEKRVSELLESFVGLKEWGIEIYIIGKDGRRFFTGEVLPRQYDEYNANWGLFRKAELADGNAVGDTHYTLKKMYDFGTAFSVGRLLKNIKTNEPLGYLIIDVMEPALVEKYAQAHLYPGGQIYLLDQYGHVVSSLPKHQIGTKLQAEFLPGVLAGKRGYFQSAGDGGKGEMIIYDTSDSTGFKLVSVVPVKEIVGESERIRFWTIAVVLTGMIAVYWLSFVLANHISRPLHKLRSLMKRVERGDMNVAFSSKYSDEVGQMGQSFNRMLEQIRYLIGENYEKQLQLSAAELKAMQAQINPHFLYNTLDSINWLARIHQVDDIGRIVVSLGELLRFSIRNGNAFVTIGEELTQIGHYLEIQQLRFRDKIRMEVCVEEEILSFYTLKLIIQPLVENAVVHGLEKKQGKGRLLLTGKRADGRIEFVVEDDGIGFSCNEIMAERSNKHSGIGLDNVRSRLRLQFGDEAGLYIRSAPGMGTTAIIWFPQTESAGEQHV